MKITHIIGLIFGLFLIFIPEPATTILGIGITGYTAHKIGWI